MKKVRWIVAVFLIFTGVASFAQEGSTAAAEQLLNQMQIQKSYAKMINNMVNLQIRRNPMMAPYRDVLMKFLNKYMSYESLKPDIVKIYAKTFTTKELKELSKFYASKVGQKAIRVMPRLTMLGRVIALAHLKGHTQELKEMIRAKAELLEKQQSTQK
jgi:uncharacterized protein